MIRRYPHRCRLARLLLLGLSGLWLVVGAGSATAEGSAEGSAPKIDIPNAALPLDRVLTGGAPSLEDLDEAQRAGYRTVVDLRMPEEAGVSEEAARVAELGMRYVALPVSGATVLSREAAEQLDRILKEAEYPMILHCASSNRVGALLALRAYHVKGMAAAEALAVGRAAGLTSLAPQVEDYLASQPPPVVDLTEGVPDRSYAPSPAHPFGRPHPQAPPELAQFAFLIGEFDCVDELLQPDGSRLRFRAIWSAHYFLNGFGIQDEYWTARFHTSNLRIFDPDSGTWKVTFFRMPGYQSGVWEGVQEGDRMVMRQGGQTTGPGLTFYDIRADGFRWHSGGDTPNWTSSCTRRR